MKPKQPHGPPMTLGNMARARHNQTRGHDQIL